MDYFESLLDRLLSLQSIALKDTLGHIPWNIWKSCVSRPHITSLSYDAGQHDLQIPPFPSDEVEATSVALQTFSYTTTMWREWVNDTEFVRDVTVLRTPLTMRPVFKFERECLSAIVLRMHKTAVSLTLPLESTPILAMARLPWPNLKELNLHGRLLDTIQIKHIRSLLPSLTSLARLSILAARPLTFERPPSISNPASPPEREVRFYTTHLPIVLRSSTARSPEPRFPHLRILEISGADPVDGIFSIPMPMLSRLVLCDHPREYHLHVLRGEIVEGNRMKKPWYSPSPTNGELLSILRRMELPLLTSLEITYHLTPRWDSDHPLLLHIVDAFPRLRHLEIHRYRINRRELTRYVRPLPRTTTA